MRYTKSVAILLEAFDQTHGAISRLDLYDRLDVDMHLTTVYRILKRLEEDGKLHSFVGKDGKKWYKKCCEKSPIYNKKSHPHFQCKKCGRVECIDVDVEVPSIQNHKIDSVDLLILGFCESCASSNPA